jgi:predicted nucleic acid-binding protein
VSGVVADTSAWIDFFAIKVGELRRVTRDRGLGVSTSDAHVAQCALDRNAVLLSRDTIFQRIAAMTSLRLR